MEIAGRRGRRRKRRTRNSCGSGHSSSLTAAKTALAVAGIVGAVVTSGSVDCLGFRVGAYVWHSVHGGFWCVDPDLKHQTSALSRRNSGRE